MASERDREHAASIRRVLLIRNVHDDHGAWCVTKGRDWVSSSIPGLILIDKLGLDDAIRLSWKVALEGETPGPAIKEAARELRLTVSEYHALQESGDFFKASQVADLLESGWFPFEPDPSEDIGGSLFDPWTN